MQNASSGGTQSQGTGLMAWYAQPFSSSMNALHWVAFLSLILITAFLWTRVLNHIEV
jgi:hypothetical protein